MITEVTIRIGQFEITQRGPENYWIRHESGEGMEISSEESLNAFKKAIDDFYNKYF